MSADESEDGNDLSDDPLDEDMDDAFMNSYSNALNEELKQTTLKKSFIRANEHSTNDNEVLSSSLLFRSCVVLDVLGWILPRVILISILSVFSCATKSTWPYGTFIL